MMIFLENSGAFGLLRFTTSRSGGSEHVAQKWKPVLRNNMPQNKEIERGFDSIKTKRALGRAKPFSRRNWAVQHFAQKWVPVLRNKMRQNNKIELGSVSGETQTALGAAAA